MDSNLRIAVLISGTGRSLQNFITLKTAGTLPVDIVQVIANTPTAKGIQFALQADIPIAVIEPQQFSGISDFSQAIFDCCRKSGCNYVILAGFLKLLEIPPDFQNRVLNIHPSLIPSFCGKGYYGHHVHEAVLEYGAKLTGCTVHFVDNEYDHGPVFLQKSVPVLEDDTPESLAARVFEAECCAYPESIAILATGRVTVVGRKVRIE